MKNIILIVLFSFAFGLNAQVIYRDDIIVEVKKEFKGLDQLSAKLAGTFTYRTFTFQLRGDPNFDINDVSLQSK